MDRIQFILLRSETLIKRMQAIRARPGATPGTTDRTFISHRLGHAYVHLDSVFFIFTFFKKKFTEIYFGFQNLQFYTPTARQGGGRGPTAPLLGGRDLFANKNKIYLRINPWWGPAAPLPGGRPPTAKWWGGRYLHLGYAPEKFLVEYTCKE